MSTRSKSDLIREALENLGVVGVDQPPSPEDIKRVDERLPSIVELLRSTEVFYISDIDHIDEAAFAPLSDIVAWQSRNKFGVTGEDVAALKIANDAAMIALKVMSRLRPTYQTLKTDFI